MTNNTTQQTNNEIKQHALLSPSSAHIWLVCPPSARMSELFPNEETEFTKEGTDAHTIAEWKVKTKLQNMNLPDPREGEINLEMDANTDRYLEFVKDVYSSYIDNGVYPFIKVEQKLDLSSFIPEGMGTADLVMLGGDTLSVIDFKYGQSKMVDATDNPQLMIYALGAYESLSEKYKIQVNKINMYIAQPRMNNFSSFALYKDELIDWKNNVLIPKAIDAYLGEKPAVKGTHCEFCKAKYLCKTFTEDKVKALEELVPMYENKDFYKNNLLSPEDLSKILTLSTGLPYWLDKVKASALEQAMNGVEIPEYSVLEKQKPSQLTEEAVPALQAMNINPWQSPKLKSKTTIKKEVGDIFFKKNIQPLLKDGEITYELVHD